MARSNYIYTIRRIKDGYILGACTVKHEVHTLVERNVDIKSVELVRYRDGVMDVGEVIPWEFEKPVKKKKVLLPSTQFFYDRAMKSSAELKAEARARAGIVGPEHCTCDVGSTADPNCPYCNPKQ